MKALGVIIVGAVNLMLPSSPTGVAATSALGTVAASSIFIIEVTGVAGTSAVGSVLAKIPITAVVTGVEGSMPFGGWGQDGFGSG